MDESNKHRHTTAVYDPCETKLMLSYFPFPFLMYFSYLTNAACMRFLNPSKPTGSLFRKDAECISGAETVRFL